MNANEPKQQSIMLTFVDKLNTYVCAYVLLLSLCVLFLLACSVLTVARLCEATQSL